MHGLRAQTAGRDLVLSLLLAVQTWVASNFSELSSRTLRNAGFAADDRLYYEFLSLLAVELVSFSKAHGRQMETTFPIVLCC